jgi:hypothetical protein
VNFLVIRYIKNFSFCFVFSYDVASMFTLYSNRLFPWVQVVTSDWSTKKRKQANHFGMLRLINKSSVFGPWVNT